MLGEKTKGVLFGIVSAASYGMNPLFTLPLYRAGMGTWSVLFYRYSIAALALAALMLVRKQSFRVRRDQILPLICMGLLFSGSSLFLFLSYRYMDAGLASAILFVYPVLVAVIGLIFFREKISAVTVLAIVMAFLGIVLLCRPSGGGTLSGIGILFVFLSSLSYAIYIVAVNHSSLREMPITKLTFYVLVFGLVVFFIGTRFCTHLQLIPRSGLWADAFCLALFPTVIALTLLSRAIKYIGPTPTAILGALEPVTALFFGVVVFHESLTLRIVVGVLLVILAVTLIIVGHSFLGKIWLGLKHIRHISHLDRLGHRSLQQ